jgi:hypothetical protein
MTSRWAVEASAARDVPLRWRAYSLAIKNEGTDVEPDEIVGREALRVVEAVWAEHGDEPIGRLYTELGNRFHLGGDISRASIAAAVEAAGLDPGFAAAAGEETWDAEIEGSMAEAIELVGDNVGVPILMFRSDGDVAGICGPIVSPAPTGEAALRLWDHVTSLVWTPEFWELKRTRTAPPLVHGQPTEPPR